jgi:hypothetical protein
MPLNIVDGPTIAANESLSDGADCSSGTIVRITVPQEFTPANLTFQVSSDGNFYNDLFDSRGNEITCVARPSTGIIISEHWARSIAFIKFRSGSRDHPVKQREDCKFAITVEAEQAAEVASAAPQRREKPPQEQPQHEGGR